MERNSLRMKLVLSFDRKVTTSPINTNDTQLLNNLISESTFV